MSIKKIITVPDETLKKISEPIEKVGVNEKKLINDLNIKKIHINLFCNFYYYWIIYNSLLK